LHELHEEYAEELAIIAWHNGDQFSFAQGDARDNWYGITGYPTVWFDGWSSVVGGYQPSSYPYYVPVMEDRVPYPSNFEVFMEITPSEGTDYNVTAQIDIKNGNSSENLAGFVVLTESDLVAAGSANQFWVARNVWPDAMGMPLDYSVETSYNWNTVVTIEDDYVLENCEAIVFIQNMDTKEIYQGTSLMMTEITTAFPAPSNLAYELVEGDVVLTWDEPEGDGLVGYNIYHAFEGGDFEVVANVQEATFTHADPEWGMHAYYVTAKYVSEESEPTNTVEVIITGIGEDLSQAVSIYPNPASDRLYIKAPQVIDRVEVLNYTGQLVRQFETNAGIVNLNVAGLEAGIYLLRLHMDAGMATRSVVIE
jgi:hypothetical protein